MFAPLSLQNKEFVCRGYDYERLEDFQQRMLGEFPQAIAMQHPNPPDDTILQSEAQCILLSSGCAGTSAPLALLWMCPSALLPSCRFLDARPPDLQVYAVTPVSDISDMPQLERVPERIKSFYRINNVSRFHYDRPFHKGPKDRDNEFRVGGAGGVPASPLRPHRRLPLRDSKAQRVAAGNSLLDSCRMFEGGRGPCSNEHLDNFPPTLEMWTNPHQTLNPAV